MEGKSTATAALKDGLKVLAFFDIFDHPLTEKEIFVLIGAKVDFADFTREIKSGLESAGGFYYLRDRRDLHEIRRKQDLSSAVLWKRVKFFKWIFALVPFVRMAAVCNNLAFGAADDDSDIDLFIVAAKNRIFTVKFFTTVLFQVLGIRRHGNKIKGRFCLSFFVSEGAMNLDSIRIDDDVYLDYWLATLKPVYGFDVMKKFIKANGSITQKFPNLDFFSEVRPVDGVCMIKRVKEFLLGGKVGDFIESRLRIFHINRLKKRADLLKIEASVVVNDRMLKFHNTDRRKLYRDEYLKRIIA
jgi:hypothetical protein